MFRATVSAATVINRLSNLWSGHKQGSKNADFGHKEGKGFGKWAAHPHPNFRGEPPGIPPPLLCLYYYTLMKVLN